MAITRQLSNGQRMTDWTEEVNELDNQYGALNAANYFQGKGVSTESVVFDKETQNTTLIPRTDRRGGKQSTGKDRKIETFSLALPYFNHVDYITPQDIQGHRKAGTPDQVQDLASAVADKLEDMRLAADQTQEFMKIQAIKGVSIDPDGGVLANMFDEFSITQKTIDFALDDANTDVDAKIALLKRTIAKDAKSGGRVGRIEVMVSPEFFDKLVSHPKIREAYLHYQVQNNRSDVLRSDLATFETWGVVDTFEHKGILFWSYDAEFNIDDGDGTETTVRGIGQVGGIGDDVQVDVGYSIVNGMKGLYRGYFGPANTLSGANGVGQESFAYQYTDPKDKFHEMELEMSPLYIMTKPQLSIKLLG